MYEIQGTAALQTVPTERNISELYERFIAYTDVKDTTIKNYTSYIRQFIGWLADNGITHPQRENVKAYKSYLDAQPYSAGTRQQYLRAVKHFFKWLSAEGLYQNIGDGIKTAKVKADNTKKEAFSPDDFKLILKSVDRNSEAGKRDYCILLLSVTGALRINEMRLANIGDLQTIRGERVLYIQGKGHDSKDDYKKIVPELADALEEYLETRSGARKCDPLFTSTSNRAKGQRISEPGVSRLIKTIFKNAGYDSDKLTAHSLRHTSNTVLFKAGADLYQVQHHARHASPETTEIYLHASDRDKDHSEQQIFDYIFSPGKKSRRQELIDLITGLSEAQIEALAPVLQTSVETIKAVY